MGTAGGVPSQETRAAALPLLLVTSTAHALPGGSGVGLSPLSLAPLFLAPVRTGHVTPEVAP